MSGHTVRVTDGVYNNARDESVSCIGCDCSFKDCSMHMKMNTIIKNISMAKRTNKEYQILHDDNGYPFVYIIRELDARKSDTCFDSVMGILKDARGSCVMNQTKQKVI